MDQEWKITFTDRQVVDAPVGLVVLEWKLNRAPESDWIKYFISGSGKSGTADFLSRAPTVVGSSVRFTVREEDLENAVRWMPGAIEGANQMFDTYVLSARRRKEPEKQAEEAAREQRLKKARQRLDGLDC